MPKGITSNTTIETALAPQYVPQNSSASSSSSDQTNTTTTALAFGEPDFEITELLKQQQTAVQGGRSGAKTGRHENKSDGYRNDKMDYIRFCKVDGTGGNQFFRGVQVPEDKRPWGYPIVTIKCVVYYVHHILQHGFQYNRKKKPWTNKKYPANDREWFVKVYNAASTKIDDRNCTNDKALKWSSSIDGNLKALRDLKTEQIATEVGQQYYNDPRFPERKRQLRSKADPVQEFKALKVMVDKRGEQERQESDFDYFKGALTDGYGPEEHKKLVEFYIKQGGYNGALFALIQGHEFQECMRNEDVLKLCLTHMGCYLCTDPARLGAYGKFLAVKVSVLSFDPKTNKSQCVCSIRGRDPLVCLCFLTGHYFFYRYTIYNYMYVCMMYVCMSCMSCMYVCMYVM